MSQFNKQSIKYKNAQKVQPPTLSWWQSVSSTMYQSSQISTNFGYKANKKYVQIKETIFQSPEDIEHKFIVIQGKRYNNRKQAKQAVKKIIWFSYRKGFNIKNEYNSDVGWGCLVRVGQMALASALLKHFQCENQRLNLGSSESDVQNIIAAFSDVEGRQQKYSLNKILQVAQKQFQQKPGEWFRLSRISYCLRILQNKHPMKGSPALKIVYFDQSINIPTILKIEKLPECACQIKSIACIHCHAGYKQQKPQDSNPFRKSTNNASSFGKKHSYFEDLTMSSQNTSFKKSITKGIKVVQPRSTDDLSSFRNKLFNKDLCLFVVSRAANPKDLKSVNQAVFMLLDMEICLGIMTGFPNKAIFIVGRESDKLIYLNPHYVQQNQNFNNSNKSSHFCQQYLLCDRTDLDPDMAFCFYIQNIAQLQILANHINIINRVYENSLSIGANFIPPTRFSIDNYLEEDEDTYSVVTDQSHFAL